MAVTVYMASIIRKNKLPLADVRKKLSKRAQGDMCSSFCTICKHPDRKRIDAAFLRGMPCTEIAKVYGSNGKGVFSDEQVKRHAKRAGLITKFLDDVEQQAYLIYDKIDTDKPATRQEFLDMLKHRAKFRKLGGYTAESTAPQQVNNYTQVNIEVKSLTDEELVKLIEAKSVLDNRIDVVGLVDESDP